MPPTSVVTVVIAEEHARIGQHPGRGLKADGDAIALDRRQKHGQVARILVDLLAAGLTVLLQLLERRHDGGHQLHDDRCGDVGHDVQREDRHPAEGTAREHVEHAQNAGGLLREDVRQRPGVDPRKRQVGPKTVNDQRANSEPQALLQLLGLGECAETDAACHAFCGGCHCCALPSRQSDPVIPGRRRPEGRSCPRRPRQPRWPTFDAPAAWISSFLAVSSPLPRMRTPSRGLGNHAGADQRRDVDRLLGVELASINGGLQTAKVHLDILLAEDVGETALRKTAVDRHLATFKAVDGHAGTRLLALVTATRRLAGSRTDAATDTLAVLGRAPDCH